MGSNILSIARTAIHAHQLAVQVTANNISNAQTEGYSRQRALIAPGDPARVHPGWVGTGVGVQDVTRIRDSVLDVSVRRESANASNFGVRRDLLGQVEGVFGEPSESGLAAGLDAFWAAWGDLASHPTDGSARSGVQQHGARVASLLNGYDRRLAELTDSAALKFQASVDEVNGLLKQVADLNGRIVAAEAGGNTSGDLRDMRDRAVDTLSQLADVQVIQRQDRTYGITIGGSTVVDGNQARPLTASLQRDGQTGRVTGFTLTERAQIVLQPGGRLGGLMETVADISGARGQLDALAANLVERVNEAHGRVPPGQDPGPPFFHAVDGARATASNIRLSDAIRNDPSAIRAGQESVGSTDNSIAMELAQFRDQRFDLSLGNNGQVVHRSFGEFYRDLVTGVAFKTSEAGRSAEVAETLSSQAETRRQSVSGVSIDEELILLMRHQQAYTAASRLVKTADEMLQTILQMV